MFIIRYVYLEKCRCVCCVLVLKEMAAATSTGLVSVMHNDAEFSKCETSQEQQAFAALAVAEAVVLDRQQYDGDEFGAFGWLDRLMEQTGADIETIATNLAKFNSTMSYYAKAGSSSSWSSEVFDVIKRTHSVHVQRLETVAMKDVIRTKTFKCQLCGKYEKNCEFVIHLAGAATSGTCVDKFDSKGWNTTDLELLCDAWDGFHAGYEAAFDTKDGDVDSIYSGVLVPGKTCMHRLMLTIKAQNMLMEVFYKAFHVFTKLQNVWSTDDSDNRSFFNCINQTCTFSMNDVSELAELISIIHDSQIRSTCPEIDEDSGFWESVLSRFARVAQIQPDATSAEFLSHAYERMNDTLAAFKNESIVCLEDDEDEDDDDDQPRRPKRLCTQRSTIVIDDDDEEEEAEDDVEYENEDDEAPRTGSSEAHQKRLVEAASRAKSASTARGLRVHPNNPLHSRKETLEDLVRVASTIPDLDERADGLFIASVMARAISMHEKRVVPDPTSNALIENATELAMKLVGVCGLRKHVQTAAIFAAAVVTLVELRGM